ncbi:hypothetical protein Glove_67g81 [Diversispora epigaea]|uniref:Uncharacterized protein n=1 Tax=Diversispora epigaea TaxID=1348612 RepID=A0A397JDS2_9GLOM|nr:hypothetical protein Glove_67g81 [Diversispora epigaea]
MLIIPGSSGSMTSPQMKRFTLNADFRHGIETQSKQFWKEIKEESTIESLYGILSLLMEGIMKILLIISKKDVVLENRRVIWMHY